MTRLKQFIDSLVLCAFGHEPLEVVHPPVRPGGKALLQCPRCKRGVEWPTPQPPLIRAPHL